MTLVEIIATNILLDVAKAVRDFDCLGYEQRRAALGTMINKLLSEELSHVAEIVMFLRRYFNSLQLTDRAEVLVMGVEELLDYLNELKRCPQKTGCLLLVYSLLDGLTDVPEQHLPRVMHLKYSLEFVIKEMATLISQPSEGDELIAVAALFEQLSYDVLIQLFDEAYVNHSGLRNICDFIVHLQCIDQQIKACLVLYRRMQFDSSRLRSGATVLAYRVKRVKRYADFPRAKYAQELRRLKLKLPEGVYAIIWNYASISAGQFMVPNARQETIGNIRCKRLTWQGTATKAARHEFITTDRGKSFAIRNTESGLFLCDFEDDFCYVEKTDDTWIVEVIKQDQEFFYKITNQRTNGSLEPPRDVRLEVDDHDADGYNLVDFGERALVVVQKFEFIRPARQCCVQ